MKKIAIFASGRGSNAEKIISHLEHSNALSIGLIVSNKKDAGVLQLASKHNIPTLIITRESFRESESILVDLQNHSCEGIVLAGFLWLIPAYLIEAYPNKILNIHPSLLPKFGGKGMYGMNVHRAVKEAGEKISGMTIHLVNQHYDEGAIIFQASTELDNNDSPEDIARKVLSLEHKYFPKIVESYFKGKMEL